MLDLAGARVEAKDLADVRPGDPYGSGSDDHPDGRRRVATVAGQAESIDLAPESDIHLDKRRPGVVGDPQIVTVDREVPHV